MTPQEALRARFEAWALTNFDYEPTYVSQGDLAEVFPDVWAAYQAGAVVPDGWQLVPKEPSEAMRLTGAVTVRENQLAAPEPLTVWVYKAMLSAAPEYKP